MKAYDALKILLQIALWGRDPDAGLLEGLEPGDWNEVHGLAVSQSVHAVAFDGVMACLDRMGLKMDPSLFKTWAAETKQTEVAGSHLIAVQRKQEQTWEKHGLHPYIVKGPVCAVRYPQPLHRVPGDIDWCFTQDGEWDAALSVIRDNKIEYRIDSDGDISYQLAGVVVEHHRRGLAERSAEGEIVFLTDHVFHHFSTSGIGLRQLCDLALALEDAEGCVDTKHLLSLLSHSGLRRFFYLVCRFLEADLGLEAVPSFVGAVSSSDIDALRAIVLEDGNFGLGKERRFSGFGGRSAICIRYAPKAFLLRWGGLLGGRMRRLLYCKTH